MKAKRKKTEVFEFEIDGVTHTGFKKVSEWEGFEKYENFQGFIITTSDTTDLFKVLNLFRGNLGDDDSNDVFIIKCSLCFLPEAVA